MRTENENETQVEKLFFAFIWLASFFREKWKDISKKYSSVSLP